MDGPDLHVAGAHGGRDPEQHGDGRAAEGLRLRHHLRHEQRVRLRLPARQHALGGQGRQARRKGVSAVAGAAALRHHRRGGQHPDRRSPDAADYLRPRPRRRHPLRQGRPHRPAIEERNPFRGQREGAHRPSDRRGGPGGGAIGRRREFLHGRAHGVAAPDRQLPEGPPPLQARRELRGQRRRSGDRRRVHRPLDARPQLERRPAPGGRGQGGRRGSASRRKTRPWPPSRCRTSSSSTARFAA